MFKDAVVNFAARPGISLEAVVSEEFRQILNIADQHSPLPSSPNTIRDWLIEKSTKICDQLKIEFRTVKESLSATIDVWTDASMLHAYIGITLHFIADSKLFCRSIGVAELQGRHTAEQIKQCLELKLNEFGLTTNDLFKIVTDNGSNMVKAFSKYEGKFDTLFIGLVNN